MPSSEPTREGAAAVPPVQADEAELVRRAQLGSAAAFERLVLARGPQLFRFLTLRLADEASTRDALQETLVAAWQGLPRLKDRGRFWPWLCGIGAHKAADIARAARDAPLRDAEASQPNEDELLDLRAALAALPDPFLEVLLLRHLLGFSEAEVAEALGVRVGTVKSRGNRARRALEGLLQ